RRDRPAGPGPVRLRLPRGRAGHGPRFGRRPASRTPAGSASHLVLRSPGEPEPPASPPTVDRGVSLRASTDGAAWIHLRYPRSGIGRGVPAGHSRAVATRSTLL